MEADPASPSRGAKPTLVYPFEAAPAAGEAVEVADGLLWARLPMTSALQHVNIWLFDEGESWTAIDCGMDTPATHEAWAALLAGPMERKPLRRIVATHGHIDHIGYAGPLCAATGADFLSTRVEWLMAEIRRQEASDNGRAEAERFYRRLGCEEEDAVAFAGVRADSAALLAPLPTRYRRFKDGDTLRMGRWDWRVITCGGHAPEHGMFVCEKAGLFICADHLLPSIVPHTAVQASEPEEDPVAEYQAGLEKIAHLPDDLLVLPSHGRPFIGVHTRIAEIGAHRARRLAAVEAAVVSPMSVREIAEAVFGHAARRGQLRQASAQTAAYVNYLVNQGALIRCGTGADGVLRYARPKQPSRRGAEPTEGGTDLTVAAAGC